MSIFKKKSSPVGSPQVATQENNSAISELVLRSIHDGVMVINNKSIIKYLNPMAVILTDCKAPENALGLAVSSLINIETKESRPLSDEENPILGVIRTGESIDNYQCSIISTLSNKRIPVAISVLPAQGDYIVTFRDISAELVREGEQTEFISTASHEMRTPVATIDGYISLALNPQTATIDERARGYLESASKASKHLGKLFQDLLDVTKLDDGRVTPHLVPVEMVGTVKQIADGHMMRAHESGINYQFGADDQRTANAHNIAQVVYGFVDVDFLREIVDNVIDNALKYTPRGGSIYIGVRGDGDNVLINVTDTGIGISASDIQHIFQKFYRADNSDTREIGGTGLGLYLVKQRAEAMGGRVWAESSFGEGTTIYISLPRITGEEYEKRMIAVRNESMMKQVVTPAPANQLITGTSMGEQSTVANQPSSQPLSQSEQSSAPQSLQPIPQIKQPQQPQPTPQTQQSQRPQSQPQQPQPQSPLPSQPQQSAPPTPMNHNPIINKNGGTV